MSIHPDMMSLLVHYTDWMTTEDRISSSILCAQEISLHSKSLYAKDFFAQPCDSIHLQFYLIHFRYDSIHISCDLIKKKCDFIIILIHYFDADCLSLWYYLILIIFSLVSVHFWRVFKWNASNDCVSFCFINNWINLCINFHYNFRNTDFFPYIFILYTCTILAKIKVQVRQYSYLLLLFPVQNSIFL